MLPLTVQLLFPSAVSMSSMPGANIFYGGPWPGPSSHDRLALSSRRTVGGSLALPPLCWCWCRPYREELVYCVAPGACVPQNCRFRNYTEKDVPYLLRTCRKILQNPKRLRKYFAALDASVTQVCRFLCRLVRAFTHTFVGL